jgi:hypothetical protein
MGWHFFNKTQIQILLSRNLYGGYPYNVKFKILKPFFVPKPLNSYQKYRQICSRVHSYLKFRVCNNEANRSQKLNELR